MCEEIPRQKIYIVINIITMEFSIGDRVFVGSTGEYGTVTKTRFLGKYGLKILSDTGSIDAYNTARAKAEIYDKKTGKNGNGDTIEPSMDVREEGVGILTSLNIPPVKQNVFFLKFVIGLSREDQESYINEFNSVKDDETKKQAFLTDILDTLEDDQALVLKEGSEALFFVDSEIRGHMFQKLLSEFSKEQRENLILEWMSVKNERKAKEAFLHKMYTNLMTGDEFIKVEGIKALSEMGLGSETQGTLFAKFLAESDEQTKKAFIDQWETVRSSKSRRREFLKNIIAGLQEDT